MITDAQRTFFLERCGAAQTIVISTHMHADGDALGSEIGLAAYLVDQGKSVRIVNQDPTAEILRFVGRERFLVETYAPQEHDALLYAVDLVILVDNSAPDRLGRMEAIMTEIAERTLVIDHHPAREMPWQHRIVDDSSCATAMMIFDLTVGEAWQPDRVIAEALYVGIATDTGFFRFNSTDAHAYRVAAQLVDRGAHPATVYKAIYERHSVQLTRLLGVALSGVRVDGGSIASVVLPAKLIDEIGARDVDTSEIMTSLLAMDGVSVALLFREIADGKIKVSLRSKGVVDVRLLASSFGGGGHRNASGIVTDGRLDELAEQIIGLAGQALAEKSDRSAER